MRPREIQQRLQILRAHRHALHRLAARGHLACDAAIPRRHPKPLHAFALRQLPSQSVLPPATAY